MVYSEEADQPAQTSEITHQLDSIISSCKCSIRANDFTAFDYLKFPKELQYYFNLQKDTCVQHPWLPYTKVTSVFSW